MILEYRYDAKEGVLRPLRRYWLSQDDHMSDEVVIAVDADEPNRYDYCLEFVCYNFRNVPKRQYVSPILHCLDGKVRFLLPSQLTRYEGHVDMQLVGVDKSDRARVFRSNDKSAHAYYVKGSAQALEPHLDDTPNVLSEVMRALDEFREIKDGVIEDFKQAAGSDLGKLLGRYRYRNVSFRVAGKEVDRVIVLEGAKLTEPQIDLPDGCLWEEGWYATGSAKPWNFETDAVTGDLTLEANLVSEGLIIINGVVQACNSRRAELYIPRYYAGARVEDVIDRGKRLKSSKFLTVHIPDTIAKEDAFAQAEFVRCYDPHPASALFESDETGALYARGRRKLLKLPDVSDETQSAIAQSVRAIAEYACAKRRTTRALDLPSGLTGIGDFAFAGCFALAEISLPPSVRKIGANAFERCDYLVKVVCRAAVPPQLGTNAFDAEQVVVYAPKESLALYRAADGWKDYDLQPIVA